jgi:hypothetical protein
MFIILDPDDFLNINALTLRKEICFLDKYGTLDLD